MRLISKVLTALLLVSLVACSESVDSENDKNIPDNVLSVTMSPPQATKNRGVGIGEQLNDQGLFRFKWSTSPEKIEVLLILKDGRKKRVIVNAVIPETFNTQKYDSKFKLTVPLPVGVKRADVDKAAFAIGVKSMTASGNVTIEPPTEIKEGNYLIPLYSNPTNVVDGKVNPVLKIYGSVLRLVLHPDPDDLGKPTTYTNVAVRNKFFQSNGYFNINTTGEPEWKSLSQSTSTRQNYFTNANGTDRAIEDYKDLVSKQTIATKQVSGYNLVSFKFDDRVSTKDKPAIVYIWGYPIKEITDKSDPLDLRMNITLVKKGGLTINTYYESTKGWQKGTGKAYTCEITPEASRLIISEVTNAFVSKTPVRGMKDETMTYAYPRREDYPVEVSKDSATNIIELCNTTNRDIDPSLYAIQTELNGKKSKRVPISSIRWTSSEQFREQGNNFIAPFYQILVFNEMVPLFLHDYITKSFVSHSIDYVSYNSSTIEKIVPYPSYPTAYMARGSALKWQVDQQQRVEEFNQMGDVMLPYGDYEGDYNPDFGKGTSGTITVLRKNASGTFDVYDRVEINKNFALDYSNRNKWAVSLIRKLSKREGKRVFDETEWGYSSASNNPDFATDPIKIYEKQEFKSEDYIEYNKRNFFFTNLGLRFFRNNPQDVENVAKFVHWFGNTNVVYNETTKQWEEVNK